MLVYRKTTPPFILVSLLFGLKSYIVYRFCFNILIENLFQEIILIVTSFATSYLLFSFSVFMKSETKQINYLKYVMLLGTLLIYFNLVFYRSFTDFLTFPQLFQTSNMGDLGTSILSLIHPLDVLIFIDVILVFYLSKNVFIKETKNFTTQRKAVVMTISLFLLSLNFFLAEIERPQLFKRGFDREYLVKNIGLFNYHIYDLFIHSVIKSKQVFADENELHEVIDYVEEHVKQQSQTNKLYNIAENKNFIFISAESLQNFVINEKIHGEEITPFLNSLVGDKDTYYFENFYHQTEQGKTSDSEFIIENSLYPSSRGAVFFTHGDNKYNSLSKMLKQKGYQSAVLHANDNTFWNRNQMYESLHIDHFLDIEYYDVNEENSVGWGLKDKEFFEQSIKHLQSFEEPFFARFITLTNHFPFKLEPEDRTLEPYDSDSRIFNNYFPTVRYMDEAIEQFFEQLKASGLYENSVIIIMGDHEAISARHHKAISKFLNKEELTPYDMFKWQRVPLFIHIPNHGEGEVVSKIAGQIDIKPTILNMVGIETSLDIHFGNDLFQEDRKEFIAFRNGDFITDDYIFASGICYDQETGEEVVSENKALNWESPCTEIEEKVEHELYLSDEIVFGNLLKYAHFINY